MKGEHDMGQYEELSEYFEITISDDKTVAYLQLRKRDEEFNCTVENLQQLLRSEKINYGIQQDVLNQIATNPNEYSHSRTPVAFGEQPVHGKDGKINYSFQLDDDKNNRPKETEDGKVDYKDVNRLNNVRKGQIIAELVPAVPGTLGMTVSGDHIAFKPGKEPKFKLGKNVVLNSQQTALYAAIDGLISVTDKGKLNVFPIYEVNGDVDYSVGNIDFVGTVVVRGNVLTGFRIVASGDIRIVGGVEGAELEAEGSIEITGGIIGYNKGLIKAGHNVKSSFIQDGNVQAGNDVIVLQSIMHSNIRAGRNVLCDGTKGLLVGGNIQASERVVARVVGNTMSTVTTIEVGVIPTLRNELTELRHQLKESILSVDKTEKALSILDQLASHGQLSSDKMIMRTKLSQTKKTQMLEQVDYKERMLEIEKMLEDASSAKVDVIKMIYGGSKIVIGRYTKYIKEPISRMSFYYHDGDISMTPYI